MKEVVKQAAPSGTAPDVQPMEFKPIISQGDLDLKAVETGAYVFAHGSIKAESIRAAGKVEAETGKIDVAGDVKAKELKATEGDINVGGDLAAEMVIAQKLMINSKDANVAVGSVFAKGVFLKTDVTVDGKTSEQMVPVDFKHGGPLKIRPVK